MATEVEASMELSTPKEDLKEETSEDEDPMRAKLAEDEDEVEGKKNGTGEAVSSADESDRIKSETEEEVDGHGKPAEEVPKKQEAKAKAEPTARKPRGPKPRSNVGTRVDLDSSLVGALDTSLAEQVKSDGMRRERKQVQHFSIDNSAKEQKAIVIVPGPGTQLNEIPYISEQIQKHKGTELATLHRILFERRGTVAEVKKNVRQFSGFSFVETSPPHVKKRAQIFKVEMASLKVLCEVLGVLKKGTKDQVVDRLLEFLMNPSDSGLKTGVGTKKSKGKSPRKSTQKSPKKTSTKSTAKPKPGTTSKPKGKKRKLDSEDDDQAGSDVEKSDSDEEKPAPRKRARDGPTRTASTGKTYEEVDDVDDDEDQKSPPPPPAKSKVVYKDDVESDSPDSEEEKKKKKKKPASKKKSPLKKGAATNGAEPKSPIKKAAKKPAASAKKFAPPLKKVKKGASESEPEPEDGSGGSEKSDDDGLKDSKLPSNSELRTTIVKIVGESDLSKVTMKMVLEKVFGSYPDIDLEKKRSYIKGVVREVM